MSYLPWITDQDLAAAVTRMATSVISAQLKAREDLSRNGLDPFSLMFNISFISPDVEAWRLSEITRQTEKGLTNAIGAFHQEIIAHVPGWEDPKGKQDFDLINHGKRVIVEMKNKHNTLNAEGKKTCYHKLFDAVNRKNSEFYQYTAYCVNIVPKKKKLGAVPFVVKDNAASVYLQNERVLLVDGYTFYATATGSGSALEDLLRVLPQVMSDLKLADVSEEAMAYVSQIFSETYK